MNTYISITKDLPENWMLSCYSFLYRNNSQNSIAEVTSTSRQAPSPLNAPQHAHHACFEGPGSCAQLQAGATLIILYQLQSSDYKCNHRVTVFCVRLLKWELGCLHMWCSSCSTISFDSVPAWSALQRKSWPLILPVLLFFNLHYFLCSLWMDYWHVSGAEFISVFQVLCKPLINITYNPGKELVNFLMWRVMCHDGSTVS